MEQKGLRYTTERIHLQGDPREPPKQEWFLHDINPSGSVPVLKIGAEIILESLEILRRLDQEFPDDVTLVAPDNEWVRHVIDSSGAFDCDGDRWLHNLSEVDEATLRAEIRNKLDWLEETLGTHEGPFFLGDKPSLIDAAYVGFLTRVETNYRFFKQLDVRTPSAGCPRFAAWLAAIESSPGGMATWQTPGTDQRVMQAHPARRASAEPCMALHPTRLGIGEDPDWVARLQAVAPQPVPLAVGSSAAMEAAWRLYERRTPLANFLLRKVAEYAAGESYWQGKRHPKSGGRDWEQLGQEGETRESADSAVEQWRWVGRGPPPYGPTDQAHRWPAPNGGGSTDDVEQQLLLVASTLVGLREDTGRAKPVGGPDQEPSHCREEDGEGGCRLISDSSPIALLGGLIGTPRDMSAAAAAQVQAALRDLISDQSMGAAAAL
jgi:glutathione S-transferase